MLQVVACLLIGQVPPSPSYPELVRDAHRNLKPVAAPFQDRYRFLIRPRRWSDAQWAGHLPTIAGWLNHLSRTQVLYPLGRDEMKLVGPGLLRVDAYKLGIREVWDRMVSPYETEATGGYRDVEAWEPWPGGVWLGSKEGYGKEFPAGAFTIKVLRRERVGTGPAQILMDGPEDGELIKDLERWTYSRAWGVRADWFINNSGYSDGRDPGYPEFAGFSDEKTFQKLGGFDEKIFRSFRLETRDAVSWSGVTLQPRAIVRDDAAGGWYYRSLDFILPKGVTDPLKVIGKDIELSYDASEQYIAKSNSLPGVGAFTGPAAKGGKGKLQRRVPENIATNHISRSKNKSIDVGVRCFICHAETLRDLTTFHRDLMSTPLKADFKEKYTGKDAEKRIEDLELQYTTNFKRKVENDRATAAGALKECCGLTPALFSAGLDKLNDDYEDAEVTTKFAAAEFGLTEKDFRGKLLVVLKNAAARGYPEVPTTIAAFVHDGPRAVRMTIKQWEEVSGQTWEMIRGVK